MTLYPAYFYSGRVATYCHRRSGNDDRAPVRPDGKSERHVEGITAEKKQVHIVEQLARNNEVIAIQLQETHCTDPDSIAIAHNVGTRSKKN